MQRRKYLRQRSYTGIDLGGILHRSLTVDKSTVHAARRRRTGLRNPLADALADLERAPAMPAKRSAAAAAAQPAQETSDHVLAEQAADLFRRQQATPPPPAPGATRDSDSCASAAARLLCGRCHRPA